MAAKSHKVALHTVRKRLNDGPEKPALADLLATHTFIQTALVGSTYPRQEKPGCWRCTRCGELLKKTFLWLHTCGKGLPLEYIDLQTAGLLTDSGSCVLCRKKCGPSAPHKCTSTLFNSTVFDMSDIFMPPPEAAREYKEWATTFRSMHGVHVVTITAAGNLQGRTRGTPLVRSLALPANAEHLRFHAIIDKTPLDPDGRGLKVAIGSEASKKIPAPAGHPVLTDSIVCAYTGLLHAAPLKNDRDLATMVVGNNTAFETGPGVFYINPLRVGGVAFLVNHAHAPTANCASFPLNGKVYLARLAEKEVHAGEELCYDYMAVTDKKKDSEIMCRCCDKPLMMYEPRREQGR